MEAHRILVVDDDRMLRKGLKSSLRGHPEIEIIGEAEDGVGAVRETRRLSPHVVLMDLAMPTMDGIEATRQIQAAGLSSAVLVLTATDTESRLFDALEAGARGYLLKTCPAETLVRAIHTIAAGGAHFDQGVASVVLEELTRARGASRPRSERVESGVLTQREGEVLRLMADGLSNGEIAERLGVTLATSRSHVARILTKLQVANRTEAAVWAHQRGLC